MCGIVGYNNVSGNQLDTMIRLVKHRGPDDQGEYRDDHVSLGHTRLSIIDLSAAGHQPMIDEKTGVVIVYNGELYNFRELRDELKKRGVTCVSGSDTEVILKSYIAFGTDCLSKFNGIFAFAIWHPQKRELFVARDRLGVKPLYYYWDGTHFAFASEQSALLALPQVRLELKPEALNVLLTLQFLPGDMSLLRNVYKLPAAHYAVLKDSHLELHRYWDVDTTTDTYHGQEAVRLIRTHIESAVTGQLISDRPVGVFLSGGIDSTLLLAMMKQHYDQKIPTFTVGFDYTDEQNKFNQDLLLARQTSQLWGTDHHEVMISGAMVRDSFFDVVRHMGEPFYNATAFLAYWLSKTASQHVPVSLAGDGGDELFGGYPRYSLHARMRQFASLPRFAQTMIATAFFSDAMKKKWLPHQEVDRYMGIKFDNRYQVEQILQPTKYQRNAGRDYMERHFFTESTHPDWQKYYMYVDLMTWMVDESLVRTDRMTMASGLEQRVPLLDHTLVELAFQISTKDKIRGDKRKIIYKQAVEDLLPPHILHAPKRGWFSPAAKWLRGDMQPLARELLSSQYNPAMTELLNFGEINSMLEAHITGTRYNSNILWLLMTLQAWYKQLSESRHV